MANKWYEEDVPRLITETDELYSRIVAKRPEADKVSLTTEKIIEARKWKPSLYLYKKNFEKAVRDLKYFYLPKLMEPGPMFVFPIRDVNGKHTCAQTKPLPGSAMYGTTKYRYIGQKPLGPRWLGNDPATLNAIIQHRCVLMVEGPFDLLACRLLCPEIPSMSPLTKFLGKHHITYLRLLGVQRLVLMYDNEEAGENKQSKGGTVAMYYQSKQIEEMGFKIKVDILDCASADASEALETDGRARQLRERLKQAFPKFYSISVCE